MFEIRSLLRSRIYSSLFLVTAAIPKQFLCTTHTVNSWSSCSQQHLTTTTFFFILCPTKFADRSEISSYCYSNYVYNSTVGIILGYMVHGQFVVLLKLLQFSFETENAVSRISILVRVSEEFPSILVQLRDHSESCDVSLSSWGHPCGDMTSGARIAWCRRDVM